jgi:hypothetical protein
MKCQLQGAAEGLLLAIVLVLFFGNSPLVTLSVLGGALLCVAVTWTIVRIKEK